MALTVADPVLNQAEIENLMEANREVSETVCTLQKDTVDYFKKIFLPTLPVKWQLIVWEEVVGVDYVLLTGTKQGPTRGRDFTSLSPCCFCSLNLAEQLWCYMATNMVLNTKKGIIIEMGVGHVIEMNNSLP